MSVPLNGPLPSSPDFVKAGTVFRLFTTNCDWNLHSYGALTPPQKSPAYKKIPHESAQATDVGIEKGNGILVTDLAPPKPFMKKGFLLRMQVQKPNVFANLNWTLNAWFKQGVNEAFMVQSPTLTLTGQLGSNPTSFDQSFTTQAVPDNYQLGTSGIASGSVHCDFVQGATSCDPSIINYTARLGTLGADTGNDLPPATPYAGGVVMASGQVLRGTPDPNIQSKNLPNIASPSVTFANYWTGVHWAIPDWSIFWTGMVMTLNVNLTFSLP